MRISLRRLALLSVVPLFATATCVDSPTGPRVGSGRATFGLTPVFSKSATFARALYASAGLELDHVRLVITRPPAEVVKDTNVVYNGTGDLPIELSIIGPVGEQLTVRLDYLSGANVLYSGTTQVTTVSPITPAGQVPQSTISIEPVGPGFNAASVTVTPSSGSFPTNAPITFTAKAFSAPNVEIAGALFAWSVDDATVGTVNASGVLTPTSKGGPIKVRATTLNETFAEVTVSLVSPPSALTLVSGGGQTATVGTPLTQIVVKVSDANGNGVAGESVTFAVASGGGSIVVNNGTTDASGLARVTWTLGSTVGSQSITATRAGLTGSPLTITATGTAVPGPTKLGFAVQPATGVAGAVISPAIQVAAQDASGNTMPSFTGAITLAIGTNPGSATLGGTVSVNAIAGVATFSNVTLNASGTGYTLTATATGLTAATSTAFNQTATATALQFLTQPLNTVQNAAISPPVQVRIVNSFGATVTSATNIITIAIGSNPGGSTLGGNPTGAAVFGIASFSTLTLDKLGNAYTLTASATGLTGATSSAFNISSPAPTTRSWSGAVSVTWTDPSNWNPVGAPSASDSLIIPSGTPFSPTIGANTGVRAIVVQSGAVLNIGSFQVSTSPGKLTNQGSLNLTNSVIGSALDNPGGTVVVQGNVSISGAVTTGTGSMLRIQGNTGPGAASLTVTSGINNSGNIELIDFGAAYGATLTVSGTLLNTAAGAIGASQGNNGQRIVSASIDNQGLISVSSVQGLTLLHTGVSSTNSGTIDISGNKLTVTQSGSGASFTNSGAITIDVGGSMTVTGGAASFTSGNVTGASGSLTLAGVSVGLTTAAMSVPLTTDAATTIVGGTLTIPAGQELVLVSSTFSSAIVLQGKLTARRTNSITGAFSNATGSTLRALGILSAGNLTIANGFTNNGTIQLTDSAAAYGASLAITSGQLVNPAASQIQPLQGANGSRTLAAQLTNAGTITISASQGLTLNKSGATHSNSGTISLTSGDLTVTQGGGGSFTTTGTVSVPTSRTLTISGGAATLGDGLVIGSGSLSLVGVAVSFTPRASLPIITSDAATAFNGGTLTVASGQELTFVSSTISSNVALSGTLTMRRTNTITGTFSNTAGSNLRAFGFLSSGDLTIANGFTNNGSIVLTDSAAAYGASLSVTTGTLTNASGITTFQGANGSRTLAAQINNPSTITISGTQGLTLNKPGAAHVSSHVIDPSLGNLTVIQSAGGSFTNTGSIPVKAGFTLTITGGSASLTDFSVSGAGSINLAGVALSFTPRTGFPLITSDAATVFNSGTLTIPASEELTFESSTISSNVSLSGKLTMRRTNTISGTFTNTSGSTLRAFGYLSLGDLTIASGFTNNGTIQLTDSAAAYGSKLTVTTGTLTNPSAGALQPLQGANGSRTLAAQLSNAGTITVSSNQGLLLSKSGAVHTNSGTISVTTGDFTVSQTAGASFTTTGPITVPSGRSLNFTGGNAALGDGLVTTAAGSVSFTGVAVTFTPRPTFPVITSDAATVFNGGSLTIGANDELTFVSSTVSSNISLSGKLTMRRTNTITGTFTNVSGSTLRAFGYLSLGDLTIANGFTNNGTIQLTDSAAAYGSKLTVTTGTLTNPASSTLTPLQGANGSRTLAAQLSNAGVITVSTNQGLTLNKSGAAHSNSGTINITTGDLTVTQSGGGTFTTTGAINVPTTRTLFLSGGSANLGAGLVTGLGSVNLAGVALTFDPRSLFPIITSDAATTFNGGTLSIADTVDLKFVSSTISSNVSLNGKLTMQRTNSITGTFTNGATSTLRAFGYLSSGDLTIANGFTNNGTIQLTDSAAAYGAKLIVTNGTLTNASGKSIQPLQGANGARTLTAQLSNAGTITVSTNQGLTINKSGALHTNTGAVNVTTGDLTLTQATGGTWTNSGSGFISIPTGRTMSISGGTAALGVNQTFGPGTLSLTGVAVSFDPRTNFPVITSNATTSFNGGTLAIPDTVELVFVSSTVASNVALSGQLTMRRTNSITGAFTNTAGSLLRAQGSLSSGDLTIANGFINNGTIQLTDSAAAYGASMTVTTGTLTNGSGATFTPVAGSGGARTVTTSVFDNQGTLSVPQGVAFTIAAQLANSATFTMGGNAGVTLNKSGAAHVNSGTITMPSITGGGAFTVGGAGTQTFSNAGTFSISSGRSLVLGATTGFSNASAGTFAAGGSVTVPSTSTFTNSGTIAPGGINTVGTMGYTGVWNPGSGGTITMDLTQLGGTDQIAITGNATLSGALTVAWLTATNTINPVLFSISGTRSGAFSSTTIPGNCIVAATNPNYTLNCTGAF